MNTSKGLAWAGAGFTTSAAVVYGARRMRSKRVPELETAPHVDLERYQGRWFEIARYPNPFERRCAKNTTAEYTLGKGGRRVVVENRCTTEDGRGYSVRGRATVANRDTGAKLRVKFGPFGSADYWIVDVAPDYRYAIVGEPKRKFLWILSRTPSVDAADRATIDLRVRAAGYDPDRLVRTPQDGA
ncbi:MAG TPA: lipocalin family protein [Candidatus Baltobacteraceae bacterium]